MSRRDEVPITVIVDQECGEEVLEALRAHKGVEVVPLTTEGDLILSPKARRMEAALLKYLDPLIKHTIKLKNGGRRVSTSHKKRVSSSSSKPSSVSPRRKRALGGPDGVPQDEAGPIQLEL